MASVKQARELASLFSAENVFFLSAVVKARVPLGLPVSKNQTVILMHIKFRVKLPDFDIPIGEKCNLIPSVYTACVKNKDGFVSYNGSTYIAIPNRKHDKNSAASHIEDFRVLVSLYEFMEACLKDGVLKPLLFASVD